MKLKAPISTAFAIALGLVVLLGYFFPLDVLKNLQVILLEWAVILAAVALWVGIANLFSVHWHKIATAKPDSAYSAILILSLLATLVVTLWFRPTHAYSLWIYNYIQLPIESSLMAILAVILAYASIRLLNRRLTAFSIIFVVTTLVVLLATGSLFSFNLPGLQELRAWIAQVPAMAGSRGILLGVALGTIATGLRILMGADRPYRG
jgi:hypothetical protein